MVTKKDPKRQLQGAVNKAKGRQFETLLDESFAHYDRLGYAAIAKTPEPMKPIKPMGDGKFIAFFEKKAQPDYAGTIKGGRSIMVEAKFTTTDRMERAKVKPGQQEYLEKHSALGATCFVIIGFASGHTYRLPWAVWRNMKDIFGRQYVKETDIQDYKVPCAKGGILLVLD